MTDNLLEAGDKVVCGLNILTVDRTTPTLAYAGNVTLKRAVAADGQVREHAKRGPWDTAPDFHIATPQRLEFVKIGREHRATCKKITDLLGRIEAHAKNAGMDEKYTLIAALEAFLPATR